jgi:hypothetical protein
VRLSSSSTLPAYATAAPCIMRRTMAPAISTRRAASCESCSWSARARLVGYESAMSLLARIDPAKTGRLVVCKRYVLWNRFSKHPWTCSGGTSESVVSSGHVPLSCHFARSRATVARVEKDRRYRIVLILAPHFPSPVRSFSLPIHSCH